MRNGGGSAPLEINRPIAFVDVDTLPGAFPSPRITDFQRAVDGVVLGRKAVAIDYRPLDATDLAYEFESAQRTLVLLEFIIGKIAKPEIFPPSRFFLPAMPLQHLCEEPAGSLLVRPWFGIKWESIQQANFYIASLIELCGEVNPRLPRLNWGSRQLAADLDFQCLAPIFKPIPQPQCRHAVVPVVALDSLKQIADFSQIVSKRSRRFVGLEGEIRFSKRHHANESIERFESFDGVALHRGAKTLPDGAVEIDEDSRPQQFIHFIDARPMPPD